MSFYRNAKLPVLALSLLFTACSTIEITKIPSKTQYASWTDKHQVTADNIKGNRYYLPRPYISVHEPFVVDSQVYFVNGVISADGKYVLLGKIRANASPELRSLIQSISTEAMIPTSYLTIKPPQKPVKGTAQSGEGNLTPSGISTGVESPSTNTTTDNQETPDTTATADDTTDLESTKNESTKTGQSNQTVTNDNNAFAMTPMRRYFDIVYLPDFDEQYALVVKNRLGNTVSNLSLGQGWSLQGLGVEVDNNEINKRMFDIIDFAAKTAKTAGLNALGIPAIAPDSSTVAVPLSDVSEAGAQNLDKTKGAKQIQQGGQPVTLKITKADYAAPGIYTILKSREVMELVPQKHKRIDYLIKPQFKTFSYAVVEPIATGISSGLPISGSQLFRSDGGEESIANEGKPCQKAENNQDVIKKLAPFITQLNLSGDEFGLNPDNDPNRQWIITPPPSVENCIIELTVKHKSSDHPPRTPLDKAKTIIETLITNEPWLDGYTLQLKEANTPETPVLNTTEETVEGGVDS